MLILVFFVCSFVLFWLFETMFLPVILVCPRTYSVDEAGLEFRHIHLPLPFSLSIGTEGGAFPFVLDASVSNLFH